MPRVELIPNSWEGKDGCGTPCIDLCRVCAKRIREGESAIVLLEDEGDAVFGSLDVDHPLYYNDGDYVCEACGKTLTYKDD